MGVLSGFCPGLVSAGSHLRLHQDAPLETVRDRWVPMACGPNVDQARSARRSHELRPARECFELKQRSGFLVVGAGRRPGRAGPWPPGSMRGPSASPRCRAPPPRRSGPPGWPPSTRPRARPGTRRGAPKVVPLNPNPRVADLEGRDPVADRLDLTGDLGAQDRPPRSPEPQQQPVDGPAGRSTAWPPAGHSRCGSPWPRPPGPAPRGPDGRPVHRNDPDDPGGPYRSRTAALMG
jgi:hypothetical protein